jgi:hypothetical protein
MRNKVLLGLGLGSAVASAAPVTVDLTDATTSVTNAGTAMIGIAVVMLGLALVYGFIKRR